MEVGVLGGESARSGVGIDSSLTSLVLLLGEGESKDSFRLISCEGLSWRRCSGDGDREGSDSGSVIEQSFRSLSLKVGGLEFVLFLL